MFGSRERVAQDAEEALAHREIETDHQRRGCPMTSTQVRPPRMTHIRTLNVVGSRYERVEHRVGRFRRSAQAPLRVRRARSAWICICVSLLITSKISPSVPMTNVVRLTGLMNERRPGETPYARATEPSVSDSSG
jgi:hypothetical protein